MTDQAVVGKKRTFKKFTYRGVDLDALLTLKPVEVLPLLTSRARRKIQRGLTRKPLALIKKLNKAKKEAPEHEKPAPVKTHLRNMIIIPEMIGSIVGVYNGKLFTQVEIKPEVRGIVSFICHMLAKVLLLIVSVLSSLLIFVVPFRPLTILCKLFTDGGTLLGRIFDHVQACQAWPSGYWSHTFLPFYPIEVKFCLHF